MIEFRRKNKVKVSSGTRGFRTRANAAGSSNRRFNGRIDIFCEVYVGEKYRVNVKNGKKKVLNFRIVVQGAI